MFMLFQDYFQLQGKRLENLKIILSSMEIREHNHYFAISMPYFVLKGKDDNYVFNDEGTYFLITDEHQKPIAFAQPDLEDSFLEVSDDLLAKNIHRQIQWLIKNVNKDSFGDDIYLKVCYIEAPVINISCVGMYKEVSKGPLFFVDSSSRVRSRTRSILHMVEMQDRKMLDRTDKGLSVFGVPPN